MNTNNNAAQNAAAVLTVTRAKLSDDDMRALIAKHSVKARTQAIVDAIRAEGHKASLERVNRLLGRFYKGQRFTDFVEIEFAAEAADPMDDVNYVGHPIHY
jgi:hypothetical protein